MADGFNGVGDAGGKEEYLASGDRVGLAVDVDDGRAVDELDEGVEGRGMLAEFLAGIEGKERDVAGFLLEEYAADDGRGLIVDEGGERGGCSKIGHD